MDLQILDTVFHGDPANEKIIISVLNDCNISKYEIEDNKGNKIRFPNKNVKTGDIIWFYTVWGKLETSTFFKTHNFWVHEFTWNLTNTICDIPGNNFNII